MAMELLGAAVFPHVVIVCVVAYLLTGHRSIYPAQRLARAKSGAPLPDTTTIRAARANAVEPAIRAASQEARSTPVEEERPGSH
jgi:hypothetical protein